MSRQFNLAVTGQKPGTDRGLLATMVYYSQMTTKLPPDNHNSMQQIPYLRWPSHNITLPLLPSLCSNINRMLCTKYFVRRMNVKTRIIIVFVGKAESGINLCIIVKHII